MATIVSSSHFAWTQDAPIWTISENSMNNCNLSGIPCVEERTKFHAMKKHLTLLALLLGTVATGMAQKEVHTLHLNSLMQNVSENNAAYKLQLTKTAGNTYKGIIYDYSNTIKAEGNYVQVGKKFLEDGYFTYYYQDGKIESEGNYARGIKVGTWKRYDANGKRKTDRYYPEESADKIRETMQLEKSEDEK